MTVYIALLRAVNVGGKNPAAMADLRAMVGDLGFDDPRSLLQSGNLVFRGTARSPSQVEQLLEAEAVRRLALKTDFLVRTAADWEMVIGHNPWPRAAARDPSHLLMMSLKDAPCAAAVRALQGAIMGRETVRAVDRQLYIVYPDGIGRSRLTNALIEKHLGTRGTGRNWNTVRRLGALAGCGTHA